MTEFEPWSSGIESNRSANFVTTTAQFLHYILVCNKIADRIRK